MGLVTLPARLRLLRGKMSGMGEDAHDSRDDDADGTPEAQGFRAVYPSEETGGTRAADLVDALRFSAPYQALVLLPRLASRATRCGCPLRPARDVLDVLDAPDACAHPRCSVIVKDGQTYAESTITVHTGEPVCLECAAALWAPEPEEIPVLLDAQEDRLIATLTAMLNSED